MKILTAITDYLANPESGDTSNAVRQDARRRFVHYCGNQVYLGRLPMNVGPIAAMIRLVDGGEQYHLGGELSAAQPVIELTVVGTDPHGAKVTAAADCLRLIFSGMAQQQLGEVFVWSVQVERTMMNMPRDFGDGSDRWVHSITVDFVFTVNQEVS